jgi:glycosyltransferase involved in cell wall biosynthesis
MKLAIVTETFPPEVNGVAMTFGVIARELAHRGHTVSIYRPKRPSPAGAVARSTFQEVPLSGAPIPGYPLLRFGWPAWRALRRTWLRERPDLVHVVTEGPLGASAITTARSLGIPVTSSFHTNFHRYAGSYGFRPLRRLALAWLRRVHNRTARTFAPTTELCAELAADGLRNLRVLSRGIDLRTFDPARRSADLRSSWGAAPEEPVVLHVGRMAAEKNYDLLFRVYAAMRAANPKLRFVLAGDGPLKDRLRREHAECIFEGFFTREEIGEHYASADIYVHASLTETFGNVLTEALASGLAVTGFDYAAARQFVRDGENGLTVPCGQPDALIAAGVKLATDAALRARLRRNAPASLASQSWEHVIARFEKDLAETIAEHANLQLAALPALAQ